MFKEPPAEQLSLLPSIEEEIYQDMPKWLKHYRRASTRIKNIAQKYNIDISKAKRFYEAAFKRFVYKLNYEHYMQNKEYFDWLQTPEAAEYIRQYIKKCDEQFERRKKEFEERIKKGLEHVVRLEVNDPELEKILDNPFFANVIYYGPFSSLLGVGLTRYDAEILLKRGYLQIEQGNLETILQHDFPQKREEKHDRFVCIICGVELDYNDIGLNKKLGAKTEKFYKCPKCIGLSDAEKKSIVNYYRSSGCNMFI